MARSPTPRQIVDRKHMTAALLMFAGIALVVIGLILFVAGFIRIGGRLGF